jgi:hypothetical protein
MAEVKGHNEPTMEEILASIRRIIAEDDGPQSAPPQGPMVVPPAADKMTSAAAASVAQGAALADAHAIRVAGADPKTRDFPPASHLGPSQSAGVPPVQEAILDLTDRIDQEDRPGPRAAGTAPSATPPLGRFNRPPPLKSGGTESSLAGDVAKRSANFSGSLAALTRIAGTGQSAREPELPLGNTGRTLEEMVRELLRPHLKEWLDSHLPRLVERMVRDEINRLVRDAQQER